MDFFGYPIWVVALICLGIFCASFMDAIGGGGVRGVAFVEAGDHGHAMQTFREQYAGEYTTVVTCEKVFK